MDRALEIPAVLTTSCSRDRASGGQLLGMPMTTCLVSRGILCVGMPKWWATESRVKVQRLSKYYQITSLGDMRWERQMCRASSSAPESWKLSLRDSGCIIASLNNRNASSLSSTRLPQRRWMLSTAIATRVGARRTVGISLVGLESCDER